MIAFYGFCSLPYSARSKCAITREFERLPDD